jgi:hypothetical protein
MLNANALKRHRFTRHKFFQKFFTGRIGRIWDARINVALLVLQKPATEMPTTNLQGSKNSSQQLFFRSDNRDGLPSAGGRHRAIGVLFELNR